MEHRILLETYYNFKNIPTFMKKITQISFIKNYNKVADIFNNNIDKVNSEWDFIKENIHFTGLTYNKFINIRMQPHISNLNKKFLLCKYRLDKNSNIVGYLSFIKNSKIYITVKN